MLLHLLNSLAACINETIKLNLSSSKVNNKSIIFISFLEHETMDFDPTNSLKRCNSTPIINLPGGSKAPASPNALIPTNVVNSASSAVTITSTTSRSR